MVWVRSPVYFYNRNGTYYFSRAVPSDLRHRFPKRKIEVSLRTKSESKAARSAAALSDRLERYRDSIRLEVFHTRELGLSLVQEIEADRSSASVSIRDALDSYLRLKGADRSKTFFQGAERAVGYLTEACGLQKCDIRRDGDTPHINLVEHPRRLLKTRGSEHVQHPSVAQEAIYFCEFFQINQCGYGVHHQYQIDK